MTVKNNRSQPVIYNPLEYHFTDAEGTSYDCTGATGLKMLSSGSLAPGAQVQGYIAGELPSAAKPVQVKFKPYIPMENWLATWQ